MQNYLDLLKDVKENGIESEDRTGTGTYSCFGRQLRFNLRDGFPAVTTKKLFFKGVVVELLWFLKGDPSPKFLQDNGVRIWNHWVKADGNLGPVYGVQWRNWNEEGRDQITSVIQSIKKDPHSRRHVVSAWNVGQLDEMALVPCHPFFQFYVRNGELSCHFLMRSSDAFIGLPFNIASYALLTHMIARECGLNVGDLIYSVGDVHIYKNHLEQVEEQLGREPKGLPNLCLNPEKQKIDDFEVADFKLEGYNPHPAIKAPIAV